MEKILILNQPWVLRHLILRWRALAFRFWVFILFLIFLLLSLYIFQIQALVGGGAQIKSLKKELEKLSEENKILEIKYSQVNSFSNIETLVKKLNFEKVDKIRYIQQGEEVLTKK